MSFSSDIRKFANKTNSNIETALRATSISLFSAIVYRTPVDTGRARANWIYTNSTPFTGTTESTKAKPMNSQVKKGLRHIITNNLPYIEGLENGGATGKPRSSQAPNGMVKVSATEFETHLKRAVAKF